MALMPVAEALARVLANTEPLPAESIPLAVAYGRVLAADVAALRTQPPAIRFAARWEWVKPRASSPAGSCRPAPTRS